MAPSSEIHAQLTERARRLNQDWKQKRVPQKGRRLGSIKQNSDLGHSDVRIAISNMCPSLTPNCLLNIFGEFKLKTISLDSDEQGKPVGTGRIVLCKDESLRLIQRFTGKLIGSKEMSFKIIAISNIEKHVRFAERLNEKESSKRIPSKQHEKTRGFLKKMENHNLNPNALVSTFSNLSI
ncbi:hypothetical protein CRE_14155 [Caenorhabditis remanei]|uniref:RRM domain-containing protein n=1 Tax=Caenorhabditis remanei TaxID=31234 RepID=E3MRJ7_CAERE|nr:hypothetical protein CRE_14155 [Caenorhabditis remanei]